jgi:phosphopantothenoylcysteine decarboxylase/phosphopantothenate--cysteine ligase
MASEIIRPTPYQPLKGKRIVFGLTASSAIYRVIDLMRLLLRWGATIRVAMSRKACRLVGRDLIEWAVGEKPIVVESGKAEHIELAEWGDAMVIAPATLNTLSKIAYGIGDEVVPLTAIAFLGSMKRVIVVSTMNLKLYNSPQNQRTLSILRSFGVSIVPPLIEEGRAKFPPLEDVAHCTEVLINRGEDMNGLKVLVTTGATVEFIDPIRVVTNLSSGLMGVLIAREAACRGANVTLVYGRTSVQLPYMVSKVKALTGEEMSKVIKSLTEKEKFDIAVFAAAVSDFKPLTTAEHKIPTRGTERIVLELVPTPKVVRHVRNRPRVMVGFLAETEPIDQIINYVRGKMRDLGFDIAIAHNTLTPSTGFSEESLDAWILTGSEIRRLGIVRKEEIARIITDYALKMLKEASH